MKRSEIGKGFLTILDAEIFEANAIRGTQFEGHSCVVVK